MRDVNGWLMVLAFLLGLVLTLGLTVRRVIREVPVTHTVAAGAAAAAVGATKAKLTGAAEKVEHKVEAVAKKAAAVVDTAEANVDDVLERDPYGKGSIRVSRRSAAPTGYTVKGDKDTGRYFTLDSPEYDAIEAEVWFADEDSAAKSGFLRWDAKAGTQAVDSGGEAATLVVHESGAIGPEALVRFAAAAAGTEGVFGKGTIKALADGSGPTGWVIKGNADSGLYHTPESPAYDVTIAEVWFIDEATAQGAGFKHWDKKRR